MVLQDFEKGEVGFMKNGERLGVAFELGEEEKAATLFPHVCLKNVKVQVK